MWVPRPRAAPTARTAARAATRHHAPLLPAVAAGAQQRQAVDPTGTPGDAVHAGGDSTGGGTDGAGAFKGAGFRRPGAGSADHRRTLRVVAARGSGDDTMCGRG